MRALSRIALLVMAPLGLSCGFTAAQPCAGRTPCQVGLTPAQLEARHYQHIVVIADVGEQPARGPTSFDPEIHALRASLAVGLSAESLKMLHPGATILFDSSYYQDRYLGRGEAGVANAMIPDTSWHLRWPSVDAVLEIRQFFPEDRPCFWSGPRCTPSNRSCCALVMYLWDVRTDSAVWIKVESLADAKVPRGQQLLGPWIGPATVQLLQEARAIQ